MFVLSSIITVVITVTIDEFAVSNEVLPPLPAPPLPRSGPPGPPLLGPPRLLGPPGAIVISVPMVVLSELPVPVTLLRAVLLPVVTVLVSPNVLVMVP